MRRRLKSATLILISQMLLIALAFAWLLQMVIIAREGSAYFIENNNYILFGEISAALLIIIFGIYVLVTQIRKLGERRKTDNITGDRRKQETP
jgi:ABC-type nickel/cobalt efflux system permease component RcnA